MEFDTIAAISTPIGTGAVSAIRISGKNAVEIGDKIFFGKKKLCSCKTHTAHYGKIKYNGKTIDEVLCLVMKGPGTYTGEDTVEIFCHGGIIVTKNVLESVLASGARQALQGEFTKRAFLNGKMDLSQSESIIDIINAKSTLEKDIALNQAGGSLQKNIFNLRQNLVEISANMMAFIDFPDEDLINDTTDTLCEKMKECLKKTDKLLSSYQSGKVIKDGINTAIIGKPNVGKSSLMNIFAGCDKSIVTDIEGTTRDVVEERVDIDGIILNLWDTAGIRESSDKVESIGVLKSKDKIQKAQLVIAVFDGSKPFSKEDEEILDIIKNKKVIGVINKTDLENVINKEYIKSFNIPVVEISTINNSGIDVLKEKIKKMFIDEELISSGQEIITNARHFEALTKCKNNLSQGINAFESGLTADMISIDLENAINALGEIVGMTVSEEIVDTIFKKFCVGK